MSHPGPKNDTDTDSGDTTLPVSEHFLTVQGEGPTMGRPAVFLRLGGCNLLCGNPEAAHAERVPDAEDLEPAEDATWVCDTIPEWRDPEMVSTTDLVETFRGKYAETLSGAGVLILTGGEPLLRQEELATFLSRLCDDPEIDVTTEQLEVEVETNGTVPTESGFDPWVSRYNVSPKLAGSGMDKDARYKPDVLEHFSGLAEETPRRATFKFVVGSTDELPEVESIVKGLGLPPEAIMLMPAGASHDELAKTREMVAEACKERGWRYSARLQVNIWNMATGV